MRSPGSVQRRHGEGGRVDVSTGRMMLTTRCKEQLAVSLYRATKLVNLRVFDDPETGKAWDKSVTDVGLEILCVSQVKPTSNSGSSSSSRYTISLPNSGGYVYCNTTTVCRLTVKV